MLIIGMTGGIGSGKSTVAELFAELGVPIIDMDILAREVVRPGEPALEEIKTVFGNNICDQNGELDRKKLRNIIFSDTDKRKQLEAITHPRIRQRVDKLLASLDSTYCIIVIPLLLETGRQDHIDRLLVIDISAEQQLSRTMQRDNISEDYAKNIIASQADRQTRLNAADDIISNNGKIAEISEQVHHLHRKYLELAHNS